MTNPADLKNIGLKATLPRLKILEIFQHSPVRHLTAEDVYRSLLNEELDIGLATVYRVLTQFEQAGLLSRSNFESGKAVFELNEGIAPRSPRVHRLRPRRRVLRCGDRTPSAIDREGSRFQAPRACARAVRRMHEGKLPAPQALRSRATLARGCKKTAVHRVRWTAVSFRLHVSCFTSAIDSQLHFDWRCSAARSAFDQRVCSGKSISSQFGRSPPRSTTMKSPALSSTISG